MSTAYLVGGPADGQEREVRPGDAVLHWAEMLPPAKASFTSGSAISSLSYRTHEYRECPETGEWLWQGAK